MIGLVWKTIYPEGKLPHFELRPESCCVVVGGGGVGGMGRSIAVCLYSSFCMFPFCCGKATVMKRNDRADRTQRTQGKWAIFCARCSGNYDNMDMENNDRERVDSFRKAQKRAKKNMAKVSEQTSGCVREDSECEASGKECLYLCVRAYMPLGRRSMQSTDA